MKPCPLGLNTTADLLLPQMKRLRRDARAAKRGEAEGIHGMRVASRRIRAIVFERGAYLKKSYREQLAREAKKITRAMGPLRELDVSVALLEDRGEKRIAAAVLKKRTKLQARGDACIESVLDSKLWRGDPARFTRPIKKGAPCLRSRASKRMGDQTRDLVQQYRQWTTTQEDEGLHALRIQCKKTRYTFEAYGPLYGPGLDEVIDALVEVQDDLGTWNDLRMTALHLESLAKPKARVTYAKLAKELDSDRQSLQASFAEDAEAFFEGDTLKRLRAQWGRPIEPCCRKER